MDDLACPEGPRWEKLRRVEAAGRPLGENFEAAVSEVAAGENLLGLQVWPFDVLPGVSATGAVPPQSDPVRLVPIVWTICPQNCGQPRGPV